MNQQKVSEQSPHQLVGQDPMQNRCKPSEGIRGFGKARWANQTNILPDGWRFPGKDRAVSIMELVG